MKNLSVFVCVTFFLVLSAITATAQAPSPVSLGAAESYAVLAGDTITNTGATTTNGDLGLFPGTSVTGAPVVHGSSNVTNGAALLAKNDLHAAWVDAGGRAGATILAAGALNGATLTPGVYKDDGAPASLGLTGTLTLNFQGDPNAVFIFQSASTLTTAVGSHIVLSNTGGGTGCNVIWRLGSAATIASTTFVGTILAHDDITLAAGVTVAGRLLAGAQANGAGALTLNNNTITVPVCGAPPPPPPPPPPPTLVCSAGVGQLGIQYSSALSASGETGPYTFSISSGTLTPGLTLNTSTGTITGTPTAAGQFTFTGNITNSLGAVLTSLSCSITITQVLSTTVPDLTITKSHSGNFQQGGSGAYTLTVRNIGAGPTSGTVAVSDTLPAGLTATAISGTGWSCVLSGLSCTRSDVLAAGGTYPPITVTVNVANNLLSGNQVGNGLTFQPGDILLSMRDGTVQWRRNDWTLVKILTSGTDAQAKGMGFDASGNLFLTHYYGTGLSGNNVVKFDPNGNLIGTFGSGFNCNPASIVFDNAGNAYVGQADCSGNILKFDSSGNLLAQFNVAIENRGSSHILLGPDQCTMYYTSEGPDVKRFNVCTNTQMPDFNTAPLPDAVDGAQQFALLPGGGMLVANFSVIARLDASGNLVRTYDAPGDTHCWLGTSLDPGGASFWASNWCSSFATRFDLATGNVIESHVAAADPFAVKQIMVVPPNLSSVVLINIAAVSGGGEANTSNNSASDSTTIVASQTQAADQAPVLSIGSSAYCVGAPWSVAASHAMPNAPVPLMGTTDGQSWMVPVWATANASGSFNVGGTFTEGTQGSYTLRIASGGKMSNSIAFVVSSCKP